EFPRLLAGADLDIAAHARSEIDDHRLVLGADALDDLGIEFDIARTLAGLWIAYMAMDHGSAGIGRLERGIGDLLWCDRNRRMLADRVAGAGHGASDDDFRIHSVLPGNGRCGE